MSAARLLYPRFVGSCQLRGEAAWSERPPGGGSGIDSPVPALALRLGVRGVGPARRGLGFAFSCLVAFAVAVEVAFRQPTKRKKILVLTKLFM